MVVLRMDSVGALEILADGRSPLRLARDVAATGRLSDDAMAKTVDALRDFRAIAEGTGARRTIAVATAALRDSENADELLTRIRDRSGIDVRVIDGEEEARFASLGAMHGLQADHGSVIDIGGGSMELSRLRDRTLVGSWTLPLGALRMSDRFLRSDPPTDAEVQALGEEARRSLVDAGVPPLAGDERLVGTGGTIRNLAKRDRRARPYPIPRLHGYVLTMRRVQDLAALLRSRRLSRRRATPGLNADRADSIVGGALVVLGTMQAIEASELIVSGQGLREGLAFEALGEGLPSADEVRRISLEALAARFATWDAGRAERRARIAERLQEALEPEAGTGPRERLVQAAFVLDIGRSVDFYRRYEHTADILTASDLAGFTHRKLAYLAAVVRYAGDESPAVRLYRPLLGADDRLPVARAATILAIADEIEHRVAPEGGIPVECEARGRSVVLTAPLFDPYRRSILADRFARAFGKRLVIRAPGGPSA